MFAIAFDMTVAQMEKLHPRSVRAGPTPNPRLIFENDRTRVDIRPF